MVFEAFFGMLASILFSFIVILIITHNIIASCLVTFLVAVCLGY